MEIRPDFTKMTADEMRTLLCEKSGMKPEQAAGIKTKATLMEHLMPYYQKVEEPRVNVTSQFAEVELEQGEYKGFVNHQVEKEVAVASGNAIPDRGSAGWQDFVIGMLQPNEYVEVKGVKFPRTAGLRRLVELLLGPIVKCGPIYLNGVTGQSATVAYEVIINMNNTGTHYSFTDIAETHAGNTSDEYAKHPAATASSRASGRAFKNALLLNVHTIEEVSSTEGSTNGPTDDIRIFNDNTGATSMQLAGIKTMCQRLEIDSFKLLANEGLSVSNLSELTRGQAQDLLTQLNKYSSTGLDSLSIPETIKIERKAE